MAKQNAVRKPRPVYSSSEPSFNALTSGKLDLMLGLNYYASSTKAAERKEWAIAYCELHYPQATEHARRAAKHKFDTFGSLARMHSRGFELNPEHIQRMHDFFDTLAPEESETHYDEEGNPIFEAPKPRPKKVVRSINAAMRNLDDNMDAAVAGENYTINVSEGNQAEVIAYCNRELEAMEEDAHCYHNGKRALKKLFKDTLEACKVVKQAIKQEKAKRITKRDVPVGKQTEEVQFLRNDQETGLKSQHPSAAVGRSKMYVYNAKYRKFMCYVSTGGGFTFKGTSLYNVDLAKSTMKKVRKPASFFKGVNGITALNKAFSSINDKERQVDTTRFSEHCLIIEITNY